MPGGHGHWGKPLALASSTKVFQPSFGVPSAFRKPGEKRNSFILMALGGAQKRERKREPIRQRVEEAAELRGRTA